MQTNYRERIQAPGGAAEIFLHSCCAPCTGEIVETLLASDIKPAIFFYNPNIYPKQEYELRKKAVMNFAAKKRVTFVDGDYDIDNWANVIAGLEKEPEGGKRCERCFFMRLSQTAKYANQNGFCVFTSTLGISRYKSFEKVTQCGKAAAAEYPNLIYWDHNWRKKGGSQRMYEVSKKEQFYAQDYCGCEYSKK